MPFCGFTEEWIERGALEKVRKYYGSSSEQSEWNLVKQADDALEARELIKGRVLENSLMSAREAAEALAPRTRSEVVQVIGTKFVLYRPSHKKDLKNKIVLVADKKKK